MQKLCLRRMNFPGMGSYTTFEAISIGRQISTVNSLRLREWKYVGHDTATFMTL